MKRSLIYLIVVSLLLGLASQPISALFWAPASLTDAAKSWIGSLNEAQKAKGVLSYDSPQRTVWVFVPLETRKGLPLREMNADQQKLAMKVLEQAVSQSGYQAATKIMSLEEVLRKLEGPGREEWRDPVKYYVTIYGSPAEDTTWGMSFEGHHLSLNFVIKGNQVIESTPQFMATNPAELKDNYGEGFTKGLRVLAKEETVAFELVTSLTEEQKKQAIIAEKALAEIRGPNKPQPADEPPVGIAYSNLNDAQKQMMRDLLDAYSSKMLNDVAKERLALIEKAGWDKVHFAWAGATQPGIGHYYRVQGPTFLVEFVNTQPDAAGNIANHIHCVWRDMTGDFNLQLK
jgi:hypothetical protein